MYTQIVAPGLSLPFADGRYAALSHTHAASAIVSGALALARGGTNADLSATGGSTSFLRQASSGATISVGGIVSADLTTALTTPPTIGGTTPGIVGASLLTVTGNTNAVQLTVRANVTQSNTNPLVRLLTSAGVELLRLHSDSATNVFLGTSAGQVNNVSGVGSQGLSNTFIGSEAGLSNTTGNSNSAQGSTALRANTTGNSNSAQGFQALFTNTSGSNNSGQGTNALYSNTTGINNSAQGMNALLSNTTGNDNSAQGFQAGRFIADGVTVNATGGTSVYLGADTKALANGGANQIVIGHNATGVGSNSVVLGNSSIATTVLRGNVGIDTTTPAARMHVVNTTAGNLSSVVTGQIIGRNDSGTPAPGFGTAILFEAKSSTTVDRDIAIDEALWSVATDASRMGRRRFGVYDVSTARYGVDMVAVSGGVQLGFYGVTPVSRAALAANATDLATALTLVNDIKTKLISLGLVS